MPLSCPSARVVDFTLKCGKSVKLQLYLLGLLAMIKCSICSYQCDS